MKSATVTVKLPIEKIEMIQKLAKGRGCGVSELLKEPIKAWLSGGPTAPSNNREVMDKLAAIEHNLSQSHKKTSALLIAATGAAAGGRYLSSLCAKYGEDITSYLSTNKPMDEKTKALREEKREADEGEYAGMIIRQALETTK